MHHGRERNEQHGSGEESGGGKEDKLELADVDHGEDGGRDEDGDRVAVGAEALEEGVQPGTSTPLTEGPD